MPADYGKLTQAQRKAAIERAARLGRERAARKARDTSRQSEAKDKRDIGSRDLTVRAATSGRALPGHMTADPAVRAKLRRSGVIGAGNQDFQAGRTLRRLGSQLKDVPGALGPGLATIGGAVGKDAVDFATLRYLRDKTKTGSHTTKDVLKPLAKDLKYLASGGPVVARVDKGGRTVYRTKEGGETFDKSKAATGIIEKFEERPLDYMLLGRGSALGAGRVAARIGQTGKLGARAKQLGSPGVRELETRTGQRFATPTSRNPVRRHEQELTRRLTTDATRKIEGTLGRELPVVGEHARAVRLGKKQQVRREQAQVSRNLRPFQRAFQGVKPSGRVAITLRAQGVSPSQMRAFVEQELRDARSKHELAVDDPAKRKALKAEIKDHERMLRVIGKTSDEVFHSIPNDPKLAAAFGAARTLSGTSGDILESLGKLDPIARAIRPYLTARVVGGARYVEEKAVKGRAAQTRLYPGRSKTVERPRTAPEAEARLTELEQFVDKRIDTVYKYLRDANPSATIGGDKRPRRVLSPADKAKTHAIGQGDYVDTSGYKLIRPQQGKKADWGKAEALIYKLAKKSYHPSLKRIAAAMDEADNLRAQLLTKKEGNVFSDPLAPAVKPDFGRVREVIPGKPRKVQLREQIATRKRGDFVGGPSIEQLKTDLADVFHFPHIGAKLPEANTSPQRQSGRVAPKVPGATKRNRAIRLLASRWLPAPEAWSDGYVKAIGYAHALDRGEMAMRIARPLNDAGETDRGWFYVNLDDVKIPRSTKERPAFQQQLDELLGEDGDLEGFVRQRVASKNPEDVQGWIERATARDGTPPRIGQISAEDYRNLFGEFAPASRLVKVLLDKPTNFWRTLTLTYRPAWVVNNFLGQNLLYAIHNGSPGGVKAYAQAALDEARGNESRYMPEELRYGLFRSEAPQTPTAGTGRMSGAAHSTVRTAAAVELKMRDAIQRFNSGVTDNTPRRAAFYHGAAKEARFLNRIEGTNRTFDEFLQELRAAAEDPVRGDAKLRATHDRLVQETLDQLIDFNDLSTAERRFVRRVVPFYSWIKGITKATVRLGLDSPLRVEFLSIVAQTLGDDVLEGLVGRGSDILRSFAPIGAPKDGPRGREQTGLGTGGLNPFQTVGDVAGYAGDVFHGEGDVKDNPALAVSPVLRGIAEAAFRRDLFTGKDLEGPRAAIPFTQFLRSFPIESTVERAVRQEDPLTASGKPRLTVPNQSTRIAGINVPNEALNYLGYPVRVKNLDTAEAIAEKNLRETLSPEERGFRKVFDERKQFLDAAKQAMPEALENGKLPKKLRDAFNVEAERQALYGRAVKGKRAGTAEYHLAKYRADLDLLVKHGLVPEERAAEVLSRAEDASYEELKDARAEISERYYQSEGGQLFYISHARRSLKEAGAAVN